MLRFNIALLPTDVLLHYIFEGLATKHFQDRADGYLLGTKALTHITLCQFHAENAQIAASAFYLWGGKKTIDLHLGAFNIRQGKDLHRDKYFAEFLITATPELIEMQSHCVDHLTQLGIPSLTPAENYTPHITLARLGASPDAGLKLDFAHNESFLVQPAIGLSSETGMFIQRL